MSDFSFVGGAYEAPSIYQDAQELINWYCEVDHTKDAQVQGQAPQRGVIALYPTHGYTVQFQLPAGEVRGMHTLSGGSQMLAVCGNTLYVVSANFSFSAIGTLSSSSGVVSIEDNGIQAYLVDGLNRYSYDLTTLTFAVIGAGDGAFTGADRVAEVDNFFVYNKPGSQEWAATTALSTATAALSFSSKDGAPDNLVSLIVSNREVFLLGETSAEVWIDVGSFPFPFQRIPGTSSQHGCAAKHSVSRLGESFAFVSQDQRGQRLIMTAIGYQFKRISTHAVENSLVGKKVSDARAFTYQIEGHEFYVVTFPTADITWVYDLATDKWHKWLATGTNNVQHRHRANCYAVFQGLSLIGDYQTGAVYALSNSVYTDNGTLIKRLRRCPHLVQDFNRVYFNDLQIQFQPGVGLTTGQGSDPQVMLRWSNDGGSTWSKEHWKSIGRQGKYKNRAIWRRLGMARDRVFEVSVTDPVNAVIVSANLNAEAGDN